MQIKTGNGSHSGLFSAAVLVEYLIKTILLDETIPTAMFPILKIIFLEYLE